MGEFQILPPVVKNLLIINALFFLADVVLRFKGIDLSDWLGLHYFQAPSFAFWQPVTYMFMHGNFGHLFFNMFALWMFGAAIENYWGTKKFLIYYFVAGVGAAVVYELWQFVDFTYIKHLQDYSGVQIAQNQTISVEKFLDHFTMVGASGAVYGLLLAFGMLFPNSLIYIYFLIPVKAKWFVIIYGGIEVLYCIFASSDGIAHIAHLGGMLFGLLLILFWRKRDRRRDTFYDYPY
ncbi:MAG: rhomboid family intramembrane serine protease [Bacteroidales bacterium]|nr:rhomboid family intramembrane serine protease [Bacteroidales bacterium]